MVRKAMERTIKISNELHAKLVKEGSKDETFDEIIKRLIKEGPK